MTLAESLKIGDVVKRRGPFVTKGYVIGTTGSWCAVRWSKIEGLRENLPVICDERELQLVTEWPR